MQKKRDLERLIPKWDVSIKSLPSGLREPGRRVDGKIARVREDGGYQGNTAL